MAEFKGTKEIWKLVEQGEPNQYIILLKENRWLISVLHNGERGDTEQRANMQLIAAAPELLAALQQLLKATCKEFPLQMDIDEAKIFAESTIQKVLK